MTVFVLKIIAVLTMLCDHIGSALLNNNGVMRSIGRTAFPIYAFLIAEGFYHIKDRPDTDTDPSSAASRSSSGSPAVKISPNVKKHFTRLLLLTLISEIPYDLMEEGRFFNWGDQSVMLTLLAGMAGLIIVEYFREFPVFVCVFYAAASLAMYLAHPNYFVSGLFLILFYYWFVNKCRDCSVAKKYLILTAFSLVYLPLYNWIRYGFPGLGDLVARSLKGWSWLVPYIWINLLFAAYNGKNGYKNKVLNTCYALFYPVHMLIIAIIEFAIGKFTL